MRRDFQEPKNGSAAAAILSAGFGCFAVGLCAWLADAFPTLKADFSFYHPTGPLSGVTTVAIVAWLILWAALSKAWSGKTVAITTTNTIAFLLLGIGFLLTFPPFGDLLLGK